MWVRGVPYDFVAAVADEEMAAFGTARGGLAVGTLRSDPGSTSGVRTVRSRPC